MDTEQHRPEEIADPQQVAEQLLEVVPRLRRIIAAEAQASGTCGTLTMSQLRVLGLLVSGQRLPSELARQLGISPATASEVVDLLVRRGLVERRGQTEDRRLTPLCLTPAGLAQWSSARERVLAALVALLARVEPSDLSDLKRGLGSLAGRLREKTPAVGGGNHVD